MISAGRFTIKKKLSEIVSSLPFPLWVPQRGDKGRCWGLPCVRGVCIWHALMRSGTLTGQHVTKLLVSFTNQLESVEPIRTSAMHTENGSSNQSLSSPLPVLLTSGFLVTATAMSPFTSPSPLHYPAALPGLCGWMSLVMPM